MWINIGDLFASATTAWAGQGGIHRRQNKPLMAGARAKTPDGFKPKDLMLIGAQAAIALQKDGWFLRNEIIWHKKGVRPENVSDRFTRTHEKVYLFTKAGSYWFDQDEVREPLVTKPRAMAGSTGPGVATTSAACWRPRPGLDGESSRTKWPGYLGDRNHQS